MTNRSPTGNRFTGVWYSRPDRRPRWWTTAKPGRCRATGVLNRLKPTRFHRPTTRGMGTPPRYAAWPARAREVPGPAGVGAPRGWPPQAVGSRAPPEEALVT